MNLSTFKEQLKTSSCSGIYLFSGREDYLKSYYIEQLIASVLPDGDDGLNYMHLDYSQARILDATDYIQALPVFANRKVLHITALDTDAVRKDIADVMESLEKDFPDYIVIIFDRITTDPQIKSVAFADIKKVAPTKANELIINEQDASMLKRWMVRHAQANAKILPDDVAEYLLSITDRCMYSLANELKKIFAYAKGETVTVDDVNAVTIRTIDAQIYELADAIVYGRASDCMRYADDLLEKHPDVMVLGSVYNCFSRLYRVSVCKDRGLSASQIADKLDMKSGTVSKNLRILRNMSTASVRKMVAICMEADREQKSFSRDKKKSMELFFLRLMDSCSQ